jgi:uncharacterized protein (DUF302 family)
MTTDETDEQAPAGLVTRRSARGVKETVDRLEAAVRERGLTLFARFDHSDAAREAGMEMPESHVLVFGSPRAGTPLMVASPLVALELPLRALVWQEAGGNVNVSYVDPNHLVSRYHLPAQLGRNLEAVEAIVAAAL